jgi:hypothetical protein
VSSFRFEVWPTEYIVITQHFGVNPQNYAQFGLPGHEGIDMRAPHGSKVFCVAPGQVFRVHTTPNNHNYGIHVRVQHREGYQTIYAHLERASVRQGQNVAAGDILGLADNTGNSFGSHLHLTLKKQGARVGSWPADIIDPTPFLLPLMGWQRPAGPFVEGWIMNTAVTLAAGLAQVDRGGATLRLGSSQTALLPEGTILIVSGERQGTFLPVKAPAVAAGIADPGPSPAPGPEPPPTVATVEGWAWRHYLILSGQKAVVGQHGINLRTAPQRDAANIGLVRRFSTVTLLGNANGDYLPVRVRRSDFQGAVQLPDTSGASPPLPGAEDGPDHYQGWIARRFATLLDRQALISRLGATLRSRADPGSTSLGQVKAFATVTVLGPVRGDFLPVQVRAADVLDGVATPPDVEPPDPFPTGAPPGPTPAPTHDTTPGWVLTAALRITGDVAVTAGQGAHLRQAPRRDATNLGYIPPHSEIIVTGPAQGEYTSVRADDAILQTPSETTSGIEPGPVGRARIGLHASADPHISEAEHVEFAAMRPGIIKVLSFHSAEDIRLLAHNHPSATWIVRAFLDFGGRYISPHQFLNDTLSDVSRALKALPGKEVVVELHNEPNLVAEGLGRSWADGASFGMWWSELLAKYRRALPGVRFIYPGLSPGYSVSGVKQDHIQFVEASRAAVEEADGLGVHVYWSNVWPMPQAVAVLDDAINRFRDKPIWVTEASNNKGGTSAAQKAQQYLYFWHELQKRAGVQGVTYFVASASNPAFAEEVWVGHNIGAMIGRR